MKKTILILGIIFLLVGISLNPTIAVFNSNDDNTPPVTTCFINGTEGNNGYYISNVEVILNATDDMSGINTTYYVIDVPPVPNIYTKPFLVEGEANHLIDYRSIDNAGNIEDWKSKNIHIDLYPPQIFLHFTFLPNSYKFIADTDDSGSSVERVEFYVGEELMFNDSDNPYEWDFNHTGGCFGVTAIAYDKAGHNAHDYVYVSRSKDFSIQQSMHLSLLRFLDHFPLLHRLLDIWRHVLL